MTTCSTESTRFWASRPIRRTLHLRDTLAWFRAEHRRAHRSIDPPCPCPSLPPRQRQLPRLANSDDAPPSLHPSSPRHGPRRALRSVLQSAEPNQRPAPCGAERALLSRHLRPRPRDDDLLPDLGRRVGQRRHGADHAHAEGPGRQLDLHPSLRRHSRRRHGHRVAPRVRPAGVDHPSRSARRTGWGSRS